MKTIKIILLLISVSILSCKEYSTNKPENIDAISKTEKEQTSILKTNSKTTDYSNVLLTIERGAFHYDKFILNDTLITFYPPSKDLTGEIKKYNTISKQKISKKTRDAFIKKIIEDGFFNLKSRYKNETSCNSHLTVTLKINKQSKKIISDDFKRKCPELLIYIEQEIIKMHNKNLKRIMLPG